MEKINWQELDESPDAAEKIISMMICEATADKRWTKLLEESDSTKFEVSLILNGVEIPFMDTLKWMINQFYSEVDKAAEDKLVSLLAEIVQRAKGDES